MFVSLLRFEPSISRVRVRRVKALTYCLFIFLWTTSFFWLCSWYAILVSEFVKVLFHTFRLLTHLCSMYIYICIGSFNLQILCSFFWYSLFVFIVRMSEGAAIVSLIVTCNGDNQSFLFVGTEFEIIVHRSFRFQRNTLFIHTYTHIHIYAIKAKFKPHLLGRAVSVYSVTYGDKVIWMYVNAQRHL